MTELARRARATRCGRVGSRRSAARRAWAARRGSAGRLSHPVALARRDARDRGSITPLVIGMFVCLLILTAGVTAAGSAFLSGQRLQRLCDGAVAAAVGAVDPARSAAGGVAAADPIAAANQYLGVRGPDVGAVITVGAQTISAQCTNQAPITFGALFGSPTLTRTVTATSQPIRRLGAPFGILEPGHTPSAPSEGTQV